MAALYRFLTRRRPRAQTSLSAVSLFSGAALSDIGYRAAGFGFLAHVELDRQRATVGCSNFPESKWIVGSVSERCAEIASAVDASGVRRLDLLVATPPCQGMSSSNPSRGRRRTDSAGKNERKNALLLDLATVAHQLQPRVIVAENVRQILTQTLRMGNRDRLVVELLEDRLPRYRFWLTVVNVADYGVPQDRRRAVIVGARSDEAWVSLLEKNRLAPWPRPTHAEHPHDARRPWIALREWLRAVSYEPLDAADAVGARGSDPLHFVPSYDAARYRLVADIPKNSGKSAYDNSTCPNCGRRSVPVDTARCPTCAGAMWNRPIVKANGELRLIRGFQSSYRRMRADRPAATITTNSSHIGSDFKIHPYENRVLSALECADLQSVPRWYDWSEALENGRAYLVRNLIGESFPPYFTYLHGRVLRQLLCNGRVRGIRLATGQVPVQ